MSILETVFYSVDLTVPPDASHGTTRILRQAILNPLAGPTGSVNPPFLYIPPEWELDDNGKVKVNSDGIKIMTKPPRKPFFSPYILTVFKILWYGEGSRWRGFSDAQITASQLAFVCALVSYPDLLCIFWRESGYLQILSFYY